MYFQPLVLTMASLRLVLLLSACFYLSSAQIPQIREIGSFRLRHAAFVEAFPKTDFDGPRNQLYDLYVSTFDPGGLMESVIRPVILLLDYEGLCLHGDKMFGLWQHYKTMR